MYTKRALLTMEKAKDEESRLDQELDSFLESAKLESVLPASASRLQNKVEDNLSNRQALLLDLQNNIDKNLDIKRIEGFIDDLESLSKNINSSNPTDSLAKIEAMSQKYGSDSTEMSAKILSYLEGASQLSPALAFFQNNPASLYALRAVSLFGSVGLWSNMISGAKSDGLSGVVDKVADTGKYFIPFVGNYWDFKESYQALKQGEWKTAALNAASGSLGLGLDVLSLTGIASVPAQGSKLAVKGMLRTGIRGIANNLLKKEIASTVTRESLEQMTKSSLTQIAKGTKYITKETAASFFNVLSFQSLRGIKSVDNANDAYRAMNSQAAKTVNKEVEVNSKLSDSQRVTKSEEVLSRDLSDTQKEALIQAHEHGKESESVGNYSFASLRKKAEILKSTDFSKSERRILMEKGLAGKPQAHDTRSQAESELSYHLENSNIRSNSQQRLVERYLRNIKYQDISINQIDSVVRKELLDYARIEQQNGVSDSELRISLSNYHNVLVTHFKSNHNVDISIRDELKVSVEQLNRGKDLANNYLANKTVSKLSETKQVHQTIQFELTKFENLSVYRSLDLSTREAASMEFSQKLKSQYESQRVLAKETEILEAKSLKEFLIASMQDFEKFDVSKSLLKGGDMNKKYTEFSREQVRNIQDNIVYHHAVVKKMLTTMKEMSKADLSDLSLIRDRTFISKYVSYLNQLGEHAHYFKGKSKIAIDQDIKKCKYYLKQLISYK